MSEKWLMPINSWPRGWMDGWTDDWMIRKTNGWVNEGMNE